MRLWLEFIGLCCGVNLLRCVNFHLSNFGKGKMKPDNV